MKAPDKIYTCYNIEEGEKRQLWSTVLLSDVEQVGEYIRKDALLEWLENKIKISDGGFVNGLVCLAYKDIIEHLNGM